MAELCGDCGGSFGSPADLAKHVKKAHAGGNPAASLAMNPASETPGLSCAFCGRSFRTREELAAHDLEPHPAPRWGATPGPG
jgi:uncharacterized C2H2 Zn-finger protein